MINGGGPQCHPRFQNRRGKRRLVRRVGEVLRLEAEPMAALIHMAVLGRECSGKKISTIELEARLRRVHLQDSSGERLEDGRGKHERIIAAIKHVIVIVPAGEPKLLVWHFNALSYFGRRREIERGARHGRDM